MGKTSSSSNCDEVVTKHCRHGMTATNFQITGESFFGVGVLGPQARYATVQRHRAERPDRLHVPPALW